MDDILVSLCMAEFETKHVRFTVIYNPYNKIDGQIKKVNSIFLEKLWIIIGDRLRE